MTKINSDYIKITQELHDAKPHKKLVVFSVLGYVRESKVDTFVVADCVFLSKIDALKEVRRIKDYFMNSLGYHEKLIRVEIKKCEVN